MIRLCFLSRSCCRRWKRFPHPRVQFGPSDTPPSKCTGKRNSTPTQQTVLLHHFSLLITIGKAMTRAIKRSNSLLMYYNLFYVDFWCVICLVYFKFSL